MFLKDQVRQSLQAAYDNNELDPSLSSAILPFLAERLEPLLARYVAKNASFPEPKKFLAIVRNFLQDGYRVQTLLDSDGPDAAQAWDELRKYFSNLTQKHWPHIGSAYQEEIISSTLIRIQGSLSSFLFVSRFATWTYTIWRNVCWKLGPKIRREQTQQSSLDEVNEDGQTLAESFPSPEPEPHETVERHQAIEDFWQRIGQLENEVNVKILRLHLEGYTLEEIKQTLGGATAPSIATIMRRKDRMLERLKADEEIKKIAVRLGILPDESQQL